MEEPRIHSITDAQPALSVDQSARYKRYLISMAIRSTCFVAAVLASGWLRWVSFAGALLLPWFAVVIANAGREHASGAAEHPLPGPNELGN